MNETIVVENGQAAVAITSVSGTLSPASSATDTIAIVDTPSGKQAALKVYNLNGGGGGEVSGDYLPATGGTGDGLYKFRRLLSNKYETKEAISLEPYLADGTVLRAFSISLGNGYAYIGGSNYVVLSYSSRYLRPDSNNTWKLGDDDNKWSNVYTTKLNNGADLAVPTEGGTLARTEDIDAAVGDISAALTTILGE